jgi:hypothetical protein
VTGFWSFLRNRVVQGFIVALVAGVVLAVVLGSPSLPFHRPAVRTASPIANVVTQLMQFVFALFVIAVAFNVTRRRSPVDFAARTPDKEIAKHEMLWLLVYGTLVLVLGSLNGIGLHLHGAIFGPTREIAPRDVFIWASYNFMFFAVIPYAIFRKRGYDHRAMCLTSDNVRNDVILILVVLVVESIGELVTFPGIFSLSGRQLLVGAPLTAFVELLGTGIPVMVFAYALLFPRYVKVTGSAQSAIVYGALTYAGLHVFEYWTVYDSLRHAALSVIFVFLQFGGPGLVKSYLTWKTGNAWVHLWAYHAIAPHVTVDTPHLIKVFRIQ